MDAERWRATCALFEDAVELDEGARDAFVASACGEDAALADEVRALLAADGEGTPLDAGAALLHQEGEEAEQRSLLGTTVAGWALTEVVGRGGTATVFRGVDAKGAKAAIKVLRPSFASPELIGRFRAERRVLAGLEHEGIPKLIDAGELEDGRPFLITAFVDGERIDRHCERSALDTRARIELFVGVCDAVHHAHTRLVVHRDLKPSNVLVDSDGRPQVLDFGIAKLLDAEERGTEWTRPGASGPMTPAYASPEQRRGEPATTASDVYSLGVMLRELVGEGRSRAARELNTVVDCARREEPAERYPSARHLAEDLRRHLAGLPIEARRQSFATRLRGVARRHPLPTLSFAAGLLALVGALGLTALALSRVSDSESMAWRAHSDAAYATRTLTDLLVDLAERDLIDRTELRAVLSEAETRIEEQLTDAPEAEARMRMALGRAYAALGDWPRADAHAQTALAIVRSARGFGRADLRAALALSVDAAIARGEARALPLASELAETCNRHLGDDHPETQRAYERRALAQAGVTAE